MLNKILKKDTYIEQRNDYFNNLSSEDKIRFQTLFDEYGVERMDLLDDPKLNELLEELYSDLGAPARDPKVLFYSYYLFTNSTCKSLDKWVKKLNSDPILQVLIGLRSEERAPSVGTHYNFAKRFLGENAETEHIAPKNKNSRKPNKPKSGQKADNPNPGLKTEQLSEGILSGESFANPDSVLFNKMLTELGIKPSIECGLIPDEIAISGDGTCCGVKASPFGHKREGLDENLRYYTAPDADIGWDSSKNCFYFGYNLYIYSFYNPLVKTDLPMCFDLFKASEHDSTASLKTLSGFFDCLPEVEIGKILFDSAHDNLATYELCQALTIEPFIDLNPWVKKPEDERGVSFSELGIPICGNGREMKFDGHSLKRGDCKWICPLKTNEHCPNQCCKNPSTHSFYTRPEKNPRFFTKTPRNSKKFKEMYKRRTASERINKRVLVDHRLEERGFKSRKLVLLTTTLAMIDIHMQAQLDYACSTENKAA